MVSVDEIIEWSEGKGIYGTPYEQEYNVDHIGSLLKYMELDRKDVKEAFSVDILYGIGQVELHKFVMNDGSIHACWTFRRLYRSNHGKDSEAELERLFQLIQVWHKAYKDGIYEEEISSVQVECEIEKEISEELGFPFDDYGWVFCVQKQEQ